MWLLRFVWDNWTGYRAEMKLMYTYKSRGPFRFFWYFVVLGCRWVV